MIEKSFEWKDFNYPENFVVIPEKLAEDIMLLFDIHSDITDVVIEEINKTSSRFGSRFAQKLLDIIHFCITKLLLTRNVKIHYVNTSDWRKALKLSVADTRKLAKEPLKKLADMVKLFNASKGSEKKALKEKIKAYKEELKAKCIHGKIDKKSISVAYVNATFGYNFNKGQNDLADSICLGVAFLKGCPTLSNKDIFQNKKRKNNDIPDAET